MLQITHIFLTFTFLSLFSYAREAKLIFSNGDSLTGEISAMSTSSIHFTHSSLSSSPSSSQEISTSALHKIIFKENEAFSSSIDSHINLTSRSFKDLPTDLYKGSINNIEDDAIILDTNFAGNIHLKKQFVQSLKMFNPKVHLLTSLGSVNTWKKSQPNMEVQKVQNSFVFLPSKSNKTYAQNYIYRPIDLPERYYIDIQLDDFFARYSSRGSFRMYLNSDEKGHYTGNLKQSIYIDVSLYDIKLVLNDSANKLDNIITKKVVRQSLKEKNLQMRIYVDTLEKNISITLNGKSFLSKVPINNLNAEHLGKHFSIGFSRNQNKRSVSNFMVTKWNSSDLPYDDEKRIALEKINPDYNKIRLHNGDFIYGEILSIDKGEALIKNQFGKFRVKLVNLTDLDIGSTDKDEIFMDLNDARFKFADGSAVIAKILSISENKIKVESQAFNGELEFDINQMTSIEFQDALYPF